MSREHGTYAAAEYEFGAAEKIADLMQISKHTVQTYVKRIYRKLQVDSKFEARRLRLINQ